MAQRRVLCVFSPGQNGETRARSEKIAETQLVTRRQWSVKRVQKQQGWIPKGWMASLSGTGTSGKGCLHAGA